MVYLFAAYGVIWALLFGYMVSIARRQREVRRQVETLRQVLDKSGA